MAGKQAKIFSDVQFKTILSDLKTTRYPLRDQVIFLFSAKAGLRAMEISGLRWSMVSDPQGNICDVISLEDHIAKKKSGRHVPMNRQLKEALIDLQETSSPDPEDFVVRTEREIKMAPHSVVLWFKRLYTRMGFDGCSSHSGRRTFITKCAKNIIKAGGSLRDVQQLAGHKSLQMTQSYIDGDSEAKRRVVDMI